MIRTCECIQYIRLGDQWACRYVTKNLHNHQVVSIESEGWGRRKEVAKRNMEKQR